MNQVMYQRWGGDVSFLLSNLVLKDFRVRYRNMSLGFGWSLANPLIMMAVLTFIFTRVLPNTAIENFPIFVLCGLVPFNFFSIGWVVGTVSMVENSSLVKRVRFPREIVPVSAVMANSIHFGIQILLLLSLVVLFGRGYNSEWVWLPLVSGLQVVFVCGLALMFAAFNVYVRDTRYVVESANTVLFWLVPIFYPFAIIPQQYTELYQYNPVAAVVLAYRHVLLEAQAPPVTLLYKLAISSFCVLGAGWLVFRRLQRGFYEHL